MAQVRRVEGQIELKCHADKFFDIWACKPFLISNICPDKIAKVELVEGEWNKPGSLKDWTYAFNVNGMQHSFVSTKARDEELDIEKRKLRYSYDDEFMLKNNFKTVKTIMQVAPKGSEGCIVKWVFEFEKMDENAPELPNGNIDFLLGVAKDIDAHLCNNT